MSSPTISPFPTRANLLGPLTTTFTPPQECSYFAILGWDDTIYLSGLDQGCYSQTPIDTTTCWPSIHSSAWATISPSLTQALEAPYSFNGLGFYSPGVHCPSGYVSACSGAVSSNGQSPFATEGDYFSFQYPLEADETGVGCCPLGYMCTLYATGDLSTQSCISSATDPKSTFDIGLCGASEYTHVYAATIPGPITYLDLLDIEAGTMTTSVTSVNLWAPLIQMNYKASDISTGQSSVATSSITLSSPSSALTNTASASPTTSPAPDDSGLSTGGKIALGVALPLCLIAVAFLAGFIWLRRRRQQRAVKHGQAGYDSSDTGRSTNPHTFSVQVDPESTPKAG